MMDDDTLAPPADQLAESMKTAQAIGSHVRARRMSATTARRLLRQAAEAHDLVPADEEDVEKAIDKAIAIDDEPRATTGTIASHCRPRWMMSGTWARIPTYPRRGNGCSAISFAASFCLACSPQGQQANRPCAWCSTWRWRPGARFPGNMFFQRCRVLLVSLEDDRDELRRRIAAARIHHGVDLAGAQGLALLLDAERHQACRDQG